MQIVSSRTAQGSVRATGAIAMVRCHPARRGFRHDADADLALDQAADRVEAAQLHAQPQRLADARGLVGEEALQRAGAVEPDEVVIEHLRERDLRALGERMVARHHQHEAVLAERIGLERAGIDGAGDDAEVGDAFGDQADDLVAQPLLEIDADVADARPGTSSAPRAGIR